MDAGRGPRPRDQLPAAGRRRTAGRLVGGRAERPRGDRGRPADRARRAAAAARVRRRARRFLFEPNTDHAPPDPGPDRPSAGACGSRGSRSRRSTVDGRTDDPEAAVATIVYRLVATGAQERGQPDRGAGGVTMATPPVLDPAATRSSSTRRSPGSRCTTRSGRTSTAATPASRCSSCSPSSPRRSPTAPTRSPSATARSSCRCSACRPAPASSARGSGRRSPTSAGHSPR